MTIEKPASPNAKKTAPKNKVALIFIVALLAMAAMTFLKEKYDIPWVKDYEEGVKLSRQTHKPLLVAFMGDTPNSKWMERDCHHNKAVVDFVEAFVPIWIDGEKHPQLMAKYDIGSYPTYVITWPEGDKDSRIIAHSSPSAFIEKLKTGLERIGPETKTD